MKAPRFPRLKGIVGALVMAATLANATAAEIRMWTDLKGRQLEAALVRIEDDSVILRLKKDGSEVPVKIERLSQEDRNYIAEFSDDPFAGMDPTTRLDSPAKKVKLDTKSWVKWEKGQAIEIPNLAFGDVIQTEHFLVGATGRIKVKPTAENAERLWHDTAFFHPSFKDRWRGDKRMAIFLVDNDEDYLTFGTWYADMLRKDARGDEANDMLKQWPFGDGGNIIADPETAEKYNIHRLVRVFKVPEDREKQFTDSDPWESPFRTHCLSGDLLRLQMGGVSSFGAQGLFWLTTGYCYYKEFNLCDRVETALITFAADTENEVSSTGLFKDGQNWTDETRRMVKRGKVEPKIPMLYALSRNNLNAEWCLLMYGFNAYLQSNLGRVTKYSELIKRVETSRQVPEPENLARIYGFDSVEEMEADWIDFMKSSSEFK